MATPRLLASRFVRAEFITTRYSACPDAGLTFEDVLAPEYWTNVSPKPKRMDTIEILPEDGSYYAEVLVVATGTAFVKVKPLVHVSLLDDDVAAADVESGVEIKWRGPAAKFSVIRTSDKKLLKDGFSDKHEAQEFARQYERAIAA